MRKLSKSKKLKKNDLEKCIAEYEALNDELGYLKFEAWYEDGENHEKQIDRLMPRLNHLQDILVDNGYLVVGEYIEEGGEG